MQRIQVTHAGSLIRPPELLAYLSAVDHGRASTDSVEYQAALARAVAYVVRRQAETGIDLIDDGKMDEKFPVSGRDSRPVVRS
jgi:5-methyltetrahydropteroyltriglutamate--homocysteine methyltransferase